MGVAFIPLHFYYKPGHPLNEQLCVVLGRERAGQYTGFYNFIGGAGSHGESEKTTLFRETEEELGLVLDDRLLQTCLIERVRVGGTTFFGCHVTGLSSQKWHQMMQARGRGCPWEYQEMDDIQHFPVAQLMSNPNISPYVQKYIPLLMRFVARIQVTQPVHYSKFKAIAPAKRMPML